MINILDDFQSLELVSRKANLLHRIQIAAHPCESHASLLFVLNAAKSALATSAQGDK